MISEAEKEQVRQATNFVELVSETVDLRMRGQEWWGCCPFHHEKSPSFKVNPATGLWHCFGCSEGGDVFNFVEKRENLSFIEAIRYLADRAHIELHESTTTRRGPQKTRVLAALKAANEYFVHELLCSKEAGAQKARAYFAQRGFGIDICKRWSLGYAPGAGALVHHLLGKGFSSQEIDAADLGYRKGDRCIDRFWDRVMFPIFDEHGATIAFGGRIITPDAKAAKYINSRDTIAFQKGRHLFAFDRAKEHIIAEGKALVCEGYTDVIALHEAGFAYSVAALGTAFRLDHIRLLERCRAEQIICLFDGDQAGQRAAERAVAYVDATKAALLCVVLPDGLDPMEYISQYGAEQFAARLAEARPLMDFVLERRLSASDLSTPGKRLAVLEELARILAPLKHSVFLHEYALRVADPLGMEVSHVEAAIKRAKPLSEEYAQQTPSRPLSAQDQAALSRASVARQTPSQRLARSESISGESLSADERLQLASERDLLAMMLLELPHFQDVQDRLGEIDWADKRHETIAFTLLSQPVDTDPATLLQRVSALEPAAPRILSSASMEDGEDLDPDMRKMLLLDMIEVCMLKRQVVQLRHVIAREGEMTAQGQEAFRRAHDAQERIRDIQLRISSSSVV